MLHIPRYHLWVGLTDQVQEGNWVFTDGTTLPEGVTFRTDNGWTTENCGFLNYDGLDDSTCSGQFVYICMTKGINQ